MNGMWQKSLEEEINGSVWQQNLEMDELCSFFHNDRDTQKYKF